MIFTEDVNSTKLTVGKRLNEKVYMKRCLRCWFRCFYFTINQTKHDCSVLIHDRLLVMQVFDILCKTPNYSHKLMFQFSLPLGDNLSNSFSAL